MLSLSLAVTTLSFIIFLPYSLFFSLSTSISLSNFPSLFFSSIYESSFLFLSPSRFCLFPWLFILLSRCFCHRLVNFFQVSIFSVFSACPSKPYRLYDKNKSSPTPTLTLNTQITPSPFPSPPSPPFPFLSANPLCLIRSQCTLEV